MPAGYGSFEFNLLPPLVQQLVDFIDTVESARLTAESLEVVEDAQGVYVLFFRGKRVYVGKTDSGAGLLTRLDRHRRNIAHRHGMDTDDVEFKAIHVAVFTAMDLENELIKRYRAEYQASGCTDPDDPLPWNGSGFGSNDPGVKRDKTKEDPATFDYKHPIDFSKPVGPFTLGKRKASELLAEARSYLPFIIRFQNSGSGRKPHPDLEASIVEVANQTMTARQIVEAVVEVLPAGWQVTRLHGRVIGYKKIDDEFETCVEWWRSPGSPEPTRHQNRQIP